jgi:Fe-S cluster assembly scaffold protein SufB
MNSHRTRSRAPVSALRQRDPAWARDFEAIQRAYEQAGGKVSALESDRMASVVVSGNRVLAANEIQGVHIEAEETDTGVRARISVDPGTRVEYPVHLCFGMIPEDGLQEIVPLFEIGEDAEVGFLAHCTFPNALDLRHVMDGQIRVGPGATMRYTEAHYHGPHGGIQVVPTSLVTVGEGGHFENEFNLTHGRVGRMEIRIEVDVAAEGVVDLVTKVYGSGDDSIQVEEVVRLNGPGARGVTKTRVAVRDRAVGEVTTTAEGNAPGARGHMDCTEIVRGAAVARNVPIVVVRDDRARVTHEAAIGSVGSKELETLMARGLDEDDAVDVIIRGMLG